MKRTGIVAVLLSVCCTIAAIAGLLTQAGTGQTGTGDGGGMIKAMSVSAQPFIDQGKSHLMAQNLLAARDQFSQAVAAEPDHQEANFLYGITRVIAVVEDGQNLNTTGLDSVREILELAGASVQNLNVYGSAMTMPHRLASTAPRTGAALNFLKTKFLPEIEGAIANLGKVNSTFSSSIPNAAIARNNGAPFTADHADALVITAMLNAVKCNLNILMVYGLDVSIPEINAHPDQLMTYKTLLQSDATLLTPIDASRLTTAKGALLTFIDTFNAAVVTMKSRSIANSHLFVIDLPVPNGANFESSSIVDIQKALADIKASLTGPRFFTSFNRGGQAAIIDLSRFFDANAPINLRQKFVDCGNSLVVPDATIGGMFPLGLTGLQETALGPRPYLLGMMCSGKETPMISLDPEYAYFPTPSNSPAQFTLTNNGTANLTSSISLKGLSPSDFVLAPGTCQTLTPSLAPGESCTFTADFQPAGGNQSAILDVASNDPARPHRYARLFSFNQSYPQDPQTYTLTAAINGTGIGTVSPAWWAWNLPQPQCANNICTWSVPVGTEIGLYAQPGNDSLFAGWSGCDKGMDECSVTMVADKNVTATFNLDNRPLKVAAFPLGGTYAAPMSVTLVANKNVELRYTLDGSVPNSSSPLYSGPITFPPLSVPTSTTLNFMGFDANGAGPMQSETYSFVPPARFSWNGAYHRVNGDGKKVDALDVGIITGSTNLNGISVIAKGPNGFSYTFTNSDIYPYLTGTLSLYKEFDAATAPLTPGTYTYTLKDAAGKTTVRSSTLTATRRDIPRVDTSTISFTRKSNASYRIIWAPVNDTKTYYYRVRINRVSDGVPVHFGVRKMDAFEDVPTGILADGTDYNVRIEATDAVSSDTVFNRTNTDYVGFKPQATDYNANKAMFNYAVVYNRAEANGGKFVTLNFNVANTDLTVTTPPVPTLAEVNGPDGFNYKFDLTADRQANGVDYLKNLPAQLTAGPYTFRVVVNGYDHSATTNLTPPVSLPVSDPATWQVSSQGNNNVRFSWADVDYTGALYYRVFVNDPATGLWIISPRSNQAYADISLTQLGSLTNKQWRVEVYDSSSNTTQRNRRDSQYVPLNVAPYDPALPVIGSYGIRNMTEYDGTTNKSNVWMGATPAPGVSITSLNVTGPNGYSRNLLAQGKLEAPFANQPYYSLTEAGSPVAGLYTFIATDSAGKMAVRYQYQPTAHPLPVVDFRTIATETDPNGDTRFLWAPAEADVPLWYQVNVWSMNDLNGDGKPDLLYQSSPAAGASHVIMKSLMSALPKPLMFRIRAHDGSNNTVMNNASQSVMAGYAGPGYDYSVLADVDADGYASNAEFLDTNPANYPLHDGPSISSFSPSSGGAGANVTINGSNFDPTKVNNTVTIGGKQATVVSATPTRIVATVPSGAVTGPITVTTAAGVAGSAASFTVMTSISFTGAVTQGDGVTPIAGAVIEMVGNPSISTSSAADGSFNLTGLPIGQAFSIKISKTGYVPAYSNNMNSGVNLTSVSAYTLFTAADQAAWGVNLTSGKGIIRSRVVDNSNRSTGYLIGAVVTATSANHPQTPYTVLYNDGQNHGGSATFANGVFMIPNVDDGDTVTVTATKPGRSFASRTFVAHADSVSQGRIFGTSVAPGDFPIATSQGREMVSDAAFDGTNYLVGIQGALSGPNNVFAQLVSPSGSLVGNRIVVGGNGGRPSVAFDGTNYLMVWADYTNGVSDIMGQLISKSGVKAGGPFMIKQAAGTLNGELHNLVFDGSNYFFVWASGSDPNSSDTIGIYGQFISPSGATLGNSLAITTSHASKMPAISFDGTNILVAWADSRNKKVCYNNGSQCRPTDIYGQFIPRSSAGAPGSFTGGSFAIVQSVQPHDNPMGIAFDGANYLITYSEMKTLPDLCPPTGCESGAYGQFVSKAGAPVGNRVAFTSATGNQVLPFPIFDGTQYLITWSDGLGGPSSLVATKGRFLKPDRNFSSPEFTLFSATTNGRVPWVTAPAGFNMGNYFTLANWGTPGLNPYDPTSYTDGDAFGAFIGKNSIQPRATISVSGQSLNFGDINVNSDSAQQSFTITNNGPGPLNFFTIHDSGRADQFALTPGNTCPQIPGALAAGQACTCNVVFKPTSIGAKNMSVSLGTDAANLPVINIGLTGNGKDVSVVPPLITSFSLPAASNDRAVAITELSGNNVVVSYCLSESSSADLCTFWGAKPSSFPFGSDGLKKLYAWGKDQYGNISEYAVRTVFVDSAPPVIPVAPSVRMITTTSAYVQWQTNEAASGKVYYGTISPPATELAESGSFLNHGLSLTGLASDTTYYVKVAATDSIGNGPVESGIVQFKTMKVPDTVPPVILAGPAMVSVSQDKATITWKTDEPSIGTVYYGENNPPTGSAPTVDPVLALNHSVVLTGLKSGTAYFAMLTVADAASNAASSQIVSFKTLAAQRTKPPVIIQGPVALDISDTAATITWTADEPANGSVSFSDGATTNRMDDPAFVATHTMRLTGLSPATQYAFSVSSIDSFGNGPSTSALKSFFTKPTPDIKPPQLTAGPNAVFITDQRAVIVWETDEVSDSLVEYGTDQNALDKSIAGIDMTAHHSFQLSNLAQGTTYYYRVHSRDAAGNEQVSSIKNFTTKAVAVVVPLVVTELPRVDFKSDSIARVIWKTNKLSDSRISIGENEADMAVLNVMDKTTGHVVMLPNLKPSTPYIILYSSTDQDNQTVYGYVGDSKVYSSTGMQAFAFTTPPVGLTTDAAPDTTAPVITGAPAITSTSDKSATIQWTTDEIADSIVYCTPDGQTAPLTFANAELTLGHSVILADLTANSTYYCQVSSTDPLGNGPTKSSGFTLTTTATPDTTPPVISNGPILTLKGSGVATLTWDTDKAASGLVRYGTSADALNEVLMGSGTITAHSLTLANLTPGTVYTYKIEVTDPAANSGTTEPLILSLKFGDCDNTGVVSIAEVQGAINMFLGLKTPTFCVDFDAAGTVSISKVQKAINTFLGL